MTPSFSVVIPTFERPDTLHQVLEALGRQAGAVDFEVVVVDDGSLDATPERLRALSPPYPFRFFRQENSGPAAARNRGVEEARGRSILFLGDDIVPEPDLLAVHAQAHEEPRPFPVAVLGYTTWPRDRRVSPFLHHINEYGLQFGYGLIQDPEAVPFNFFYTSNISLPSGEKDMWAPAPFGMDMTGCGPPPLPGTRMSFASPLQGHRNSTSPPAVQRRKCPLTPMVLSCRGLLPSLFITQTSSRPSRSD